MIIRSSRVVMPDGERPASIHIHDGIITDVTRPSSPESAPSGGGADEAIDVGDLVVSPGIVDTHVHVNEPGRTEWEGFDTATRAAAAGGVTTIVDMPLNSIPATTTVAALEAKRAAARRYLESYFQKMRVEVYWGTAQAFLAELSERWAEAGGT